MKKLLLLIMFLTLIAGVNLYAQNRTISGKIMDGSNQVLPGVNIIEKGTTNGTTSDANGKYTLPITEGAILIFSFVGYEAKELVVGTNQTLNVNLQEDVSQLSEVVVVGYGTVKKSDLTGSVSTINAETAYKAPAANLENALQGRASGVQVTSSNGSPGSAPSIRIRGGNSISAGNDPLYVIDGFIGAATSINPNDIESMQILKDASSTAIYGARGANGVIIITTKKGKAGQMKVNLKTSFGVQKLPAKVDVQTGAEYAAWVNSQSADQNNLPFDLNNLPGEVTDWQDAVIGSAAISDHQVAVSGGSERSNYYLSAGFLNQDGIVKGTGFKRYSLRSNIETKLSKIFRTGLNLSISRTYKDVNDINFKDLIRQDPLKPVYDNEGNYNVQDYGVGSSYSPNLLAENVLNLHENTTDRAFINTFLQASLFNKVTVRSTFGGDFSFFKEDEFTPSTNPFSLRNSRLGVARITQRKSIDLLNENTIDYKESFGNHSINILGGVTFQTANVTNTGISASEIPSDGVGINAVQLAPLEHTSISSGYSQTSMLSYLARANYSYAGKYLLTASLRRDASSRLGGAAATFPSFAMAWNIAKESFFKNVSAIDQLKVRTSYGWTGSQSVGAYSTVATYAAGGTAAIINGIEVPGVTQGNLANPDLKWERTEQIDLGLEIGLFQNRLSAEVDLYYKKTRDLLLDAEVPDHTGYKTRTQNIGSVENRGIDFTLSGVLIQAKDFEWNASINISKYKNKVLDLGNKSFISTLNLPSPAADIATQLIVGQPVGTFWGAVYEGIDPNTGDAIMADLSGPDGVPDGVYDPLYNKTVIGNANPDFYGGFQTDFKFKNFDFNAFFPFSYGNDIYNMEAFVVTETTINSYAKLREKMWSASKPENATIPRVGSTSFNRSNSFYIQDGSFLRLGTLQLGYTLPSGLLKGISNCRFFATGTNLFLLKNKDYWGFDPDVSGYGDHATRRGFDNMQYPQNRSFIIGLDISF